MIQANTNSRIGATDEIDNFPDGACGCCGGWWTSLYSGIVYDDHDGGCGSYPHECYDDDAEYKKRLTSSHKLDSPDLEIPAVGGSGKLPSEQRWCGVRQG